MFEIVTRWLSPTGPNDDSHRATASYRTRTGVLISVDAMFTLAAGTAAAVDGACCLPEDSLLLDAAARDAEGGKFLGVDAECPLDGCPADPPVRFVGRDGPAVDLDPLPGNASLTFYRVGDRATGEDPAASSPVLLVQRAVGGVLSSSTSRRPLAPLSVRGEWGRLLPPLLRLQG